jgi:single-stranded DNA-binding protein
MNSCILMAEIIKNPELRYTADNQIAVTDMFVQFAPPFGSRPDDPHPTLEVIGWNNLATEMKEKYKKGDRVIVEGRLEMNTIERDGYKEKRARLIASRLHHFTEDVSTSTPANPPTSVSVAPDEPSRVVSFPKVSEEPPAIDFPNADDEQIPF